MPEPPEPELTDEELAEFRAFLAARRATAAASGGAAGSATAATSGAASDSATTDSPPTPRASAGAAGASATPGPSVPRGIASTPGTAEVGYIRGGGGLAVDTGRAVRIFVAFCVAALAALVIILTISAMHQNNRLSRLQHHGVPVDVTVTGCVGLASGTGVTQYGFTCRGDFTLDGRSYNEVIGGTTDVQEPGAVIHALVIPGDPTVLSTTTSVVNRHASRSVYITPAILFGLFVVGAILLVWLIRRSRRPRTAPETSGSIA